MILSAALRRGVSGALIPDYIGVTCNPLKQGLTTFRGLVFYKILSVSDVEGWDLCNRIGNNPPGPEGSNGNYQILCAVEHLAGVGCQIELIKNSSKKVCAAFK